MAPLLLCAGWPRAMPCHAMSWFHVPCHILACRAMPYFGVSWRVMNIPCHAVSGFFGDIYIYIYIYFFFFYVYMYIIYIYIYEKYVRVYAVNYLRSYAYVSYYFISKYQNDSIPLFSIFLLPL